MSLLFGIIVGFSLGLTGGGGSIFAVPLLVYGLSIPVHQAIGVSLAAVGATALGGALGHLRSGDLELQTGLIFGAAGIFGAPIGTWIGAKLPPAALLAAFALLMLLVAVRMWRQAEGKPNEADIVRAGCEKSASAGPACRRDPNSELQLSSRCMLVLCLAGFLTGLMSGLLGVGGGFLIVPALVLTASLPIQRAIATSLLVIAIISAAGVCSHLLAGQALDLSLTSFFVLGGLAGMGLGILLSQRLAGPTLQKLFAAMMVAVAGFILARDLFGY